MSLQQSPFKFLDAYQQDDHAIFFGREQETEALYEALSGVKQLLVYGPSGAGKTSLIECGLRNQFSDADWFALTIRRGSNVVASVYQSINEALENPIPLDEITQLPKDKSKSFGHAIEDLFSERYQPIYLLFDQFEELLLLGKEEEKRDFFTRLHELIRYKVPCRVLLIMREEFIGHLSEYEPLCPSLFQNRFRLEKMGPDGVRAVIKQTLAAPQFQAFFTVEDAEGLANAVRPSLNDPQKEIELTHLQVFLSELWDRARTAALPQEMPHLSRRLLQKEDNLETVLDSFLKKQLKELDATHRENTALEVLAAMISERHTKLQLSKEEIEQDLRGNGIELANPTLLLTDLKERRLVRTLKTGSRPRYEISHDVLARIVGQNLTEEMRMREKAREVYRVYGERQGVLSQQDLDYLRPYQAYLAPPPELIERMEEGKQQAAEKYARARRQLRLVRGLLVVAVLGLLTAGFFAWRANEGKKKALAEEAKARQAVLDFQRENADKERLKFQDLKRRANIILDIGGCPLEILQEMRQITEGHPDSTAFKTTLSQLANKNPDCI
ncbi:MAG: ATP-binding protein [Lewinellaceae bacterium]|nr:ATP-binding protein [Phaeodactylibacter sp.]MCB9036365.1 ATP-binding protein [Lewinellaceae bacterium]